MVCVGSSAMIKYHQVDSGRALGPLNGVEFTFGRRGKASLWVRTANPVVCLPRIRPVRRGAAPKRRRAKSLSAESVKFGLRAVGMFHYKYFDVSLVKTITTLALSFGDANSEGASPSLHV
jgi:hypothetical protein